MKKYKLINGNKPMVYAGSRKELLNGNYPITRRMEVVFSKDGIGEAEDDVDMSHFVKDGVMQEIIAVVVPVVETVVEPVVDAVVETAAEKPEEVVEQEEAPAVEVAVEEEVVEQESEVAEEKEITTVIPVAAKLRGRKPKVRK